MTHQPKPVEALRSEWAGRKGSQIGQYRLGHAKVGVLFQEIDRLRERLEGLHFHHKMFEPDCRHCRMALLPPGVEP